MAEIDNLNFKVILDDQDFNSKITKDIEAAKKLNVQLSQLLQAKVKITQISAQDAANAKRASDVLTKQATDQERINQAKAKTAKAEEEVRTQAAKTAKELARAQQATSAAALNQQRLATEAQRTATATNNAATSAQRLQTETQRTATEVQRTATATQNAANATARAQLAQKRLADYSKQTVSHMQSQSRLMNELKGYVLGYLSIHGVSRLISSLVRVTGEFELQKATLAAILGDLNKAEQVITRIQELAVESPFQFKELTTYAKQLSAFSVPAEELYETTKMLADVSAGLGVGMDRIVLAYGQVRSAAFLRGQEVRQFTEAGIPILNMLAKQFEELEGRAVSTGEVFDRISARLVPFEMVAKVFKDMTSEGGKFYNMQEVQAETLRGKLSNLKDAYEVMLNEIGSQKSGAIKGAVDSVRELMQNWEKVGMILKTLIVTFGLYKATLGAVWTFEKILAADAMLKRYHRMNSLMVALTGSTNKLAVAMRVMGTASKTAVSLGVAAVGALVSILIIAAKRAGELRKELESIMTSELSGSDKMVDDLDRLVENLKNATKGSQEYRDIISELNRKYGEFLPNILSEADAYDKVKYAADAAAEAIRNKAKASAFEKGSVAIEEKYGNKLTKSIKEFEDTLMMLDPSISSEYAREFMKNFKAALASEGASLDVLETFRTSFDEYFGAGSYEKFTAKYLKPEALENAAKSYAKILKKVSKAEQDLQEDIDSRFEGTEFSSLDERTKVSEVEKWYREEKENLKSLEMSQEAYNDKVNELDIKKLEKLVEVYTELGRTDIAKSYQKQLDALTKIPEGWRGKVQGILKKMGLGENSSFGLWADDTTQATAYVDDMVKRYKELKEEIKRVSSFDPKLAEKLGKEKTAIEAIAKELKVDIVNLSANKSDTTESKAEKKLKRLIDTLRDLQDQYEKLKGVGVSDESIKSLFKGLYPDLISEEGEEFVTDLNYIERAIEYAKELEKLNSEAGKKLLVDLGGDEFTLYLKNLEKQEKKYKEIAKAAGEYFDALRKWRAEDFNLEGEGITFDIDKISTELSSKIGGIELKTQKIKETFDQIGISDISKHSEEDIKKIKALFEKEFGEGSWDFFYKEFLSKGENAFRSLAEKEIAYERKIAQEKINNLAKSYVSEATSSLDMSDWSDKSIGQIEFIRGKLLELMSADLPISDSLKKELELLGLSTDDLIAKIKELFGGEFDTATIEKMKAVQDAAKNMFSYADKVKDALESLAEATNNDLLKGASQIVGFMHEMADSILESESLMAQLSLRFGDVSKMSEEAVENLKKVANSSDWITMVIKIVLMGIEKIASAIAKTNEFLEYQSDLWAEYKSITREVHIDKYLSLFDTIFGKDALGELRANANVAKGIINEVIDLSKTAVTGAGEKRFGWLETELGWWAKTFAGGGNIEKFSLDQLIDKSGMLSDEGFKKLQAFYDAGNLNEASKDRAEELLAYYKQYKEATESIANSIESTFDSLASDIADTMIDSFLRIGDATADLAKGFDNIRESIGKMIMQSALVEALQPFIDDVTSVFNTYMATGNITAFAESMDSVLSNMAAMLDSDAWNELAKILQDSNLLGATEEAAADLGEGIKGITEDQANLLASYLNAIRADVSFSKALWVRMDANLQRIAEIFTSSPTLMEYQAQIAANTFNSSQATQQILAELRSVITNDGSDTAIRIYS